MKIWTINVQSSHYIIFTQIVWIIFNSILYNIYLKIITLSFYIINVIKLNINDIEAKINVFTIDVNILQLQKFQGETILDTFK